MGRGSGEVGRGEGTREVGNSSGNYLQNPTDIESLLLTLLLTLLVVAATPYRAPAFHSHVSNTAAHTREPLCLAPYYYSCSYITYYCDH